jgi:RIP metalloprotease RseP
LEQPQTPDRPDLVNPTANGPTSAASSVDGASTEPPPPAVPLTPISWLSQNGPYLVVFAVVVGVIYWFLDVEGLVKAAVVVVGLGFVIFVHELGHFLAAKWCDVHIQTFSLGFGPAMPGCSFRRGETLYKIAILPLGGYVAMVGEGSDADEEENYPRSFKNKSVGQRMIIISAGVVMNMILGFLCFVIVFYLHGVNRTRGMVHSVEPASPAWKEGVRSGYRISRIDGKENPTFEDLRFAVMGSWHNARIPFEFRAPHSESPALTVELQPRRDPNDDTPVIGVTSPEKLKLRSGRDKKIYQYPYIADSAASKARIIALQPGEVVVKATVAESGESLAPATGQHRLHWQDLARWLGEHSGKTVMLEISTQSGENEPATKLVSVPVDGLHFSDTVVGTTNPDQPIDRYDPMLVEPLPPDPDDPTKDTGDIFVFYQRMKQLAGRPLVIQVRREGQGRDAPPTKLLLPAAFTPTTGMVMDIGHVAGIRKGSPAEQAKVQDGDKIVAVELSLPLSDAAAIVLGHPRIILADLQNPDPMRLTFDLEQAARRLPGPKVVQLSVLRENQGASEGNGDPHHGSATVPLGPVPWDESWDYNSELPGKPTSPTSIPQLGIAYWVGCTVTEVKPGSPAAVAGIKKGDRVAELQAQQPFSKKEPEKVVWSDYSKLESTRENGRVDYDQWAFYSHNLQWLSLFDSPAIRVKVVRQGALVQEGGKDKEFEIQTKPDETWPSESVGVLFQADTHLEKATSIWNAFSLGLNETGGATLRIYVGIRNVATNRIKITRGLGGPLMIATQAFGAAEDPFDFLLFMGMISVNLAVLNFLPIPVLDGGHMVLLIYEKIRGKPPSDMWRNVLTIAGLIFLLLLMLGATFLDISKFLKFL